MSDHIAGNTSGVSDDICGTITSLLTSSLGMPEGSLLALPSTRVLGAIPEMDSMSVVTILISIEEQFGIVVHDDEVDATIFETVGSLAGFVRSKLG